MDDILLTGNDVTEIAALKSFLNDTFKIKDLGYAHYFLGIEILESEQGLLLTQRKYTMDLLQEFDSNSVSPIICLFYLNTKLTPDTGDLLEDPSIYTSCLGSSTSLLIPGQILPSQCNV